MYTPLCKAVKLCSLEFPEVLMIEKSYIVSMSRVNSTSQGIGRCKKSSQVWRGVCVCECVVGVGRIVFLLLVFFWAS